MADKSVVQKQGSLRNPERGKAVRGQTEMVAGLPLHSLRWMAFDKSETGQTKRAGRLLDGREWNEFPEVSQ